MRVCLRAALGVLAVFVALLVLHYPLLRLPYFWDEAGYYVPAALDFYRSGLLIPQTTLSSGHTPLVTVYLALAWQVFGFSAWVTRAAMILVAAGSVAGLYALGWRVAGREAAIWSAALLSLSPLFFAQSSLAYLDLAAGLFTTLAVLALIDGRLWTFAATASLAVLSKETAVVLLPVAWVYAWRRTGAHRGAPLPQKWTPLATPLLPLAGWALYYRHATGYWTGNPEYLAYNLYSTLVPARILWSFLRRFYEVFLGGFNWLLVAGALGGWWCRWKNTRAEARPHIAPPGFPRDFLFLAAGLVSIYIVMLSVVGGAVLPRYLLPIFPLLILAAVIFIWGLPRWLAHSVCVTAAGCFIWAWFINPPYPFPFEDNLAYADFVRLHQHAASFLQAQPGAPRILTAWPATDELTRPYLGYVHGPLHVVPVESFTAQDFRNITVDSFDLLYLYSREWEPRNNWMSRFSFWQKAQERYFNYQPQIAKETLVARYPLKLLQHFETRGQWVDIYGKR